MSIGWAIYEYLLCLIDVGLMCLFLSKIIDCKSSFSKVFSVLGVLSLSALLFIATYIDLFSSKRVLFTLAMLYVYAIIFFHGAKWKLLLAVTATFLLFGLSDFITTIIFGAIAKESFQTIGIIQNTYRVSYTVLSKMILLFLFGIIVNFKGNSATFLPLKYNIIFLLVFFAAILTILLLFNIIFNIQGSDSLYKTTISITCSLFLLCIVFYYLFYRMCFYFASSNEKNMAEYQVEILNKYISEKEESDQEIRMMCHDAKHYIVELREMIESGNGNAAIELMSKYNKNILEIENSFLDAGIPSATAIVNRTYTESQSNNVKFNFEGFIDETINMNSTDICIMLGNIFDNALEATINVSELDKREIRISIKRDKDFLFLSVDNSYEYEPLVKNNTFITRKQNRSRHGIGMMSIENIVKKYNGSIDCTYQNGWFSVFIMLPVYDKKI